MYAILLFYCDCGLSSTNFPPQSLHDRYYGSIFRVVDIFAKFNPGVIFECPLVTDLINQVKWTMDYGQTSIFGRNNHLTLRRHLRRRLVGKNKYSKERTAILLHL